MLCQASNTMNFDSALWACVALLQTITFDTWTDPMCAAYTYI